MEQKFHSDVVQIGGTFSWLLLAHGTIFSVCI